jgi:selenocysteine-specific elongation factor
LRQQGRIIRIEEDLYIGARAFEAAVNQVADALKERGALTTSELKEVLGTSRRHAVPLLELMDAKHLTRRQGELRVWIGARTQSDPTPDRPV